MPPLLEWQNLIYYLSMATGVLMVLGSAFGGHDHGHDAGHDVHHDVGHDAHGHGGHDDGHHHETGKGGGARHAHNPLDAAPAHVHGFHPFSGFASILGVGRVPFTIILMMAALFFGTIGIIANMVLAQANFPAWLTFLISAPVAFVGMVALTGVSARAVNKVMPTSESYYVTKEDLVGRTGTLVVAADAVTGFLQLNDQEGNLQEVQCRTNGAPIAKGQEVLVIDYDPEKGSYLVEPCPAETKIQNT